MSHRLRVTLDATYNQTDVVWDILENLNPQKSKTQADMLKYLSSSSDERSKKVFENRHNPELDLHFCTWLNNQGKPAQSQTIEDAKQFKYFGEINLGSFLLRFSIIQYPFGNPLLAEISLHMPVAFIFYDLHYRHLCRNVVAEFANKLNSTMAIYFYDDGDIEGIFLNNFRIFEYGEKETRPIQEFLDEIQKIAPPLDWDTDYSEMEQEFSDKAYFVDYYI